MHTSLSNGAETTWSFSVRLQLLERGNRLLVCQARNRCRVMIITHSDSTGCTATQRLTTLATRPVPPRFTPEPAFHPRDSANYIKGVRLYMYVMVGCLGGDDSVTNVDRGALV